MLALLNLLVYVRLTQVHLICDGGTGRAMRVAVAREVDSLETSLPFLATVGSISHISVYLERCGVSCMRLLLLER